MMTHARGKPADHEGGFDWPALEFVFVERYDIHHLRG